VQLSCADTQELESLIKKCIAKNLRFTIFREPDINNQITAICIEPSQETRKITAKLPKMFQEYVVSPEKLQLA